MNSGKANRPKNATLKKSHNKSKKLKKKIKIVFKSNMNDTKAPPAKKTFNKEFLDILEELKDLQQKKGEFMRAKAYQTAAETLMTINEDITNVNQLKDEKGFGKTILAKLQEFVDTGTIKALEKDRANPINLLTNIYGVGAKKANELIKVGIKNIDDVRERGMHMLNDKQKIGVKYYEDILARIPRAEVEAYEKVFKKAVKDVNIPGTEFEIVGSYRRGNKTSGDIDVIITNKDNNHKAFEEFLDKLHEENIIIEFLSRGPTKSLVMGQIPDHRPRRVDFMYTNPDEYGAAVMYFTGSKAFNVNMRAHALSMGYSLNEHGITHKSGGVKGDKVDIKLPTEQSVFDFLKLKYIKPTERTDGRMIISADNDSVGDEKSTTEEPEIFKLKIKKKNKTLKKSPSKALEHIENFKQKGIDTLKLLTEKELGEMIKTANLTYYSEGESSLMTDEQYDIVKEYIERTYPKNKEIQAIGAEVSRNKVQLPYNMPSMDKIKPDTDAIDKWKAKYSGPYVLSGKADGVSGLYTTEGDEPKLYTRGNGTIGQDVSNMIPYLKLPTTKDITIRGEFIMKKRVFDDKYKDKFANPRNLVAGIVNQQKDDVSKYKDIDFVAYEVIKPELEPSKQFDFLEKENVDVIVHKTVKTIDNDILSKLLVEWREKYEYETDGVIVMDDKIYKRSAKNPEHGFAFKMVLSEQTAEAKVLDVIWTPSKDGYLKPRIQIEPIKLGGVKIEYATAFNGAFVEDNKLGIGSVVLLVRSGDVIPHIMKVIKSSSAAKMPDVPYKWNETHVDVMLENAEDDNTVKLKNITGFFRGIGVEGLSSGNIQRIMNAGYDTVPKIISMSKADLLTIDGFKDKMATKIESGIKEKMEEVSLPKLISASNILGRGFGDKRLTLVLDELPDILTSDETISEKEKKVSELKGMAKKTAELFANKIPEVVKFIKQTGYESKLTSHKKEKKTYNENHPLYEKKVVMTGFRDEALTKKIESHGAEMASSVSSKTFVVIVKDLTDDTGKAENARKLNIPVMTAEQFTEKYL